MQYEFQVPDGSNSGFYLGGRHEIQIRGDCKSGKPGKGSNGAIYNHTAPGEFASKPGGEWQTTEATIIGNNITVMIGEGSRVMVIRRKPGRDFPEADFAR